MTCKSRLYDLLFGTSGNSIDEITKNAKLFVAEAVSEWPKLVTRIYKEQSQKITDFIRAKAPWMPGGQHGDTIHNVVNDNELEAFQEMMDEVVKFYSDEGKYNRYIDFGELAIYFKENPMFFKEGNINALITTTDHFKTAGAMDDFIVKLDASGAAARRTQWHTFIESLQQGLLDKFGDIRGKQLFDDLGLQATKTANEMNKIMFKWGKSMWDNQFAAAKATGATDEIATEFAMMSGQTHTNMFGGISGGSYKNQWEAKKGLLAWLKGHPKWALLGGILGSGFIIRMLPWYMMDNMPFYFYAGRDAGVVEKTFGDKEGEIARMIATCGYQLRDFPCDTQVQTNFVELLTLLKELNDMAMSSDPVPPGKLNEFKELYKTLYAISEGVPNEFMRMRVKIDYSMAHTEYVLRVTEAGCANPIAPPDGWTGVSGTGSIKCTSDLVSLVYLDDLYIGIVHAAGFVIAGVEPGSHTVRMEYAGKPDCIKTVNVVSGREANADCTFAVACTPPVPKITAPATGTTGAAVQFNGSATTESTIKYWTWDFGDGYGAKTQNASHNFTTPGTYTIQLTVTDDCGTVTTNHIIKIEEAGACTLPVPTITSMATGETGESLTFMGSATTDSSISYWTWDFGDGGDAHTKNATHVFTDAGTFTVRLSVSDDCGNAQAERSITITESGIETATVYIGMPKDLSVYGTPNIPWNTFPEVYVDEQYKRKAPGSVLFGGYGPPSLGTHRVSVRATGYQEVSKSFTLAAGDSESWYPGMYPDGYVKPPEPPTGCIQSKTASSLSIKIDAVADATQYMVRCSGYFIDINAQTVKDLFTSSTTPTIYNLRTSSGYQVSLAVKVAGEWSVVSSTIGNCTGAGTFEIGFYLPAGASLSTGTKISRITTGIQSFSDRMRRIGGR